MTLCGPLTWAEDPYLARLPAGMLSSHRGGQGFKSPQLHPMNSQVSGLHIGKRRGGRAYCQGKRYPRRPPDPSPISATGGTVPGAIHHSVVVVGDLEASLRFYRDGLGLEVLQTATSRVTGRVCSARPLAACAPCSLGDPGIPDDHAGVLELNVFDGDVPAGPPPSPPRTGFFLLSSSSMWRPRCTSLCRFRPGRAAAACHSADAEWTGNDSDRRDPTGCRLLTPGSITRRPLTG